MFSRTATILVVDDEPIVTNLLSTSLGERGYSCITAPTGEDALRELSRGNIDVALLDLRLPGVSGIDVLREIKSTYPGTAVIVVTAVGDAQTAVDAMKMGAVDYIIKPFEVEKVNHSVELALQAMTIWKNKSTPQGEDAETRNEDIDWTCYLDDIACGVETRLDSLTGHVMVITIVDRTCAIGRSLGIPEDQIEKWADDRRKHIEQANILDSLLEKVEQSPVA